MWIHQNKIINGSTGVTIDGIQHPQSIFSLWTKNQLAEIGIKPYHPARVPAGERVTSSTTEEVDGEIYERVTTEVVPPAPDTRTYAEKRAAEYPSLSELNVALWEKVVENRPEAAEALEVARQAIKAKYPKPETTE